MQISASIFENGEYIGHNPDWHAADAPQKARWILEMLDRNKLDPSHITEVGCGSGEILVRLQEHLPQAVFEGFDTSSQAIALAAPKQRNRLVFRHGDYIAAEAGRPDLLMAIDVFEHVEDYMGFIRALKPRAEWKLFHIPLDLSVQGLLRGTPLTHSREAVGHLHYFCKDTALATLRDCGHEIVDWQYTLGAESLPNRKLRTRLLNLPRRLARAINQDFAIRALGGASLLVLTR